MPVSKVRGWSQQDVLQDFTLREGKLFWSTGPRKGSKAGWVNKQGYSCIRYKGVLVKSHNLVWLMVNGTWPEYEVDHRDNNPSNNLPDNLRLADRKGQGSNQKLQTRRVGKFKGVHKSSSGKFYVKIKHLGKQNYFGSFDSELEAAMTYNINAEKLFGEFASLNKVFIDKEGVND